MVDDGISPILDIQSWVLAFPKLTEHRLPPLLNTSCSSKKKAGREIYYHFNPAKMKEIDQWLNQFKRLWEDRFNQLDNVLTK